jgi:hypothetical protein
VTLPDKSEAPAMTGPDLTSGGFALEHAALSVPPVHIPDGAGGAYKTELVIERTPERTVKILWWHADDPRPEPHNHPWAFESKILHGGYSEDRYRLQPDGADLAVVHERCTYRAGDINRVPRDVFHNVVDVQPGTVTRLVCGPAAPGNEWHYLDIETGELSGSDDPAFRARLAAINPHLRPRTTPDSGTP